LLLFTGVVVVFVYVQLFVISLMPGVSTIYN